MTGRRRQPTAVRIAIAAASAAFVAGLLASSGGTALASTTWQTVSPDSTTWQRVSPDSTTWQ